MYQVARITWKDMLVIFRDRAALILMIGGPLLLTLGMGLITGAFSGDQTQLFPVIPVLVLNQDEGDLGQGLADLLGSADLADLVAPEPATDAELAQESVAEGNYAAAIIIPAGFSAGMLPDPDTGEMTAAAAPIQIYADPARTVSSGIINSIVSDYVNQVRTGITTVQVGLDQLMAANLVPPEQLPLIGRQMGEALATQTENRAAEMVVIDTQSVRIGGGTDFNPLAYFAPAMALLFLMYTVTIGARSFLAERQQKTLARMLVAPVPASQILGGKVLGIFMSGLLQVSVLIGLSALLFGLSWGSPFGVMLLIVTAAAAATGWGLLVASIASTPAQISTIGTTLMLSFGILGGSFVPINQAGPLLQTLSKLTPNAWALDGFASLAAGGGLTDLAVPLAALTIMAITLFAIATLIFRSRRTALVVG